MNKEDKTITERISKNKQLLLEQFKKNPIIEISCQKISIGRATYYRWRKDDIKFAAQADEALLDARQKINEMAESQLISAMKDGNMTALIFWLKNNDKRYANRLELSAVKEEQPLTAEQEKAVTKALALGGIMNTNSENYEEPKNNKYHKGR